MPSKPRSRAPSRPAGPPSTALEHAGHPSQALFRSIFDNAPIGIYWSTPDGQLLLANQELARILGYDLPQELLHLDLARDVYVRAADRRQLVALYTGHDEPQTAEAEWRKRDGAPIWVQIRARTVRERGRPLYFESFVLDVTRRKRAEEELKASQERFERVFQASPAAVVIARSKDGVIVDVNRAWTELFGWTREEAVGRTSVELGAVKAVERAERVKLLERDGRVQGADWRVTTKSGQVRDVLFSVELLELAGEQCMIALSIDVTNRRHAEEALRDSEERLQLLGRATMKDVIWDWDVAADTVWWGEAVQNAFGYRPEELGRSADSWRTRVHPADAARVFADQARVLNGDSDSWSGEYRFRRADGSYAAVLDRFYIVRDPSGKAIRVVGSLMDLTESRQAQAELRELAARLQSIREDERKRLSRELHDELGQVLTALKIDLSHLRRALPKRDAAAHERVEGMKGLLDRAAAETHRMAMELRPAILDDLGLVSAVRWLVEDFSRRVGITCELVLEDLEEPLPGDLPTAVFRIVQETLTNIARHASASRVDVRLSQDARGITVQVRDDGKGIPRASLAKEQHFGLLGLRERAAQLGGEVTVHSRRDRGTSVVARVPIPTS